MFQVTAYDPGVETAGARCKVEDWNSSSTETDVNVLCFNSSGAAAEGIFPASPMRTKTHSEKTSDHEPAGRLGLGQQRNGHDRLHTIDDLSKVQRL